MEWMKLIKKGNLSSGLAALSNLIVAVVKLIVAFVSGNGTMFATAMHSFADTINQLFVFLGSILSEMAPFKRFPKGFGRLINIFCMVAVIVVTLMAYETIKTGWTLTIAPKDYSNSPLIIIVLVLAFFIVGFILFKTRRDITKESEIVNQGN